MQIDLDNIVAAVVTVVGAGGAGAVMTAWWNGRTAARKQAEEDRRKEAEETRTAAKQAEELRVQAAEQAAKLDKEVSEWDRAGKMKEEEFITSMRKRLVLEMKADNDNIRRRLDDRERAEKELRQECDSLRAKCGTLQKQCDELQKNCDGLQGDHARCQSENKDLRLQLQVLKRAVKQIEKKQGDSDEHDGKVQAKIALDVEVDTADPTETDPEKNGGGSR